MREYIKCQLAVNTNEYMLPYPSSTKLKCSKSISKQNSESSVKSKVNYNNILLMNAAQMAKFIINTVHEM